MTAVFLHCRPGFESECAAEICSAARCHGAEGFCRAAADSGYVLFETTVEPLALVRTLPFSELCFTRQWFAVLEHRDDLTPGRRVEALERMLAAAPAPLKRLFLEAPDTEASKPLARLIRALRPPLEQALRRAGRIDERRGLWQAHVCLLHGSSAWVGCSAADNAAPWPGGVPRLRLPAAAPSRSALKLEEALLRFLGPEKRDRLLQPGMRAVDLGAAPGGWTWLLSRRGLRVTAVDNGALAPALLQDPLVTHQRSDGFAFRPVRPVDWLVCDMVEQPRWVARLVARWYREGWCRRAIFNLKLPMKRRLAEWLACRTLIAETVNPAEVAHSLQAKHLYHDRDEITVYLAPPVP